MIKELKVKIILNENNSEEEIYHLLSYMKLNDRIKDWECLEEVF